ncbi:MAG: hypothetical protein HeimC2_27800 [Candidatus Heimdallarchaeota archaeon LC_2]|nr:MAG: hypothetical protein HeimC2_27800 [Candidatus Heimdallarchaeota archaeon LC_2]
MKTMISEKLGRLDLCIDIKNVKISYEFYKNMGYEMVEGNLEEGWGVMEIGNLRLGLYEGMSKYDEFGNKISLNFRGGKVKEITEEIIDHGYSFYKKFNEGKKGGGNSSIYDPNGVSLFFDTAPPEIDLLDRVQLNNITKSDLGLCDICFDVEDLLSTIKFYTDLGLSKIDGSEDEGWIILGQGNLRLSLYQGNGKDLTINFRDGNIKAITQRLKQNGLKFNTENIQEDDGTISSMMVDPDGYLIYFNS